MSEPQGLAGLLFVFIHILFHAWIWMLCLNQSKQKQTGQKKQSRYS